MNRRTFLTLAAAAPLSSLAKSSSDLVVEGYIFQQYAALQKKPLMALMPDIVAMVKDAGYKNVELNPGFFPPDSRDTTVQLLRKAGLRMPSVYVGGSMHEPGLAQKTIDEALATARFCQPFGCKGVVNNPDPKPHDEPKSDSELDVQAQQLNAMGRQLADAGFELRVHHHTPQLENNAREWRHILAHTDPQYVKICVDVDWAYEGGFDPVPFLKEAGQRVRELHVRSARNKIWLEDVEDSDIDYRAVASYLKSAGLSPEIVVELAYRPQTKITRSLAEDLRVSREYVERIF